MYDMFFVSGTTPKPAATDDPLNSKGQIAVFNLKVSSDLRKFWKFTEKKRFLSSVATLSLNVIWGCSVMAQSRHVSAVVLREIEKILNFLHYGHTENWG